LRHVASIHNRPKTQINYLRAVINLTCFLGQSPDTATPEDLRRYQLHLVETGTSSISLNAAITALRFFFGVTLDRPEALAKMSPVREPRKLHRSTRRFYPLLMVPGCAPAKWWVSRSVISTAPA
jgi:hypothetical protein